MQQAFGTLFSRFMPQCVCSSCMTEEADSELALGLSEAVLPPGESRPSAGDAPQNPVLLSSGRRGGEHPPLKRNWLPAEERSGSEMLSERDGDASKLQWTVVSQSILTFARVGDGEATAESNRLCSEQPRGTLDDKGQFGPNSNHRCNSHDACNGVVSNSSHVDHVQSHHHSYNDANLDVSPTATAISATMVTIPPLANTAPMSPPPPFGSSVAGSSQRPPRTSSWTPNKQADRTNETDMANGASPSVASPDQGEIGERAASSVAASPPPLLVTPPKKWPAAAPASPNVVNVRLESPSAAGFIFPSPPSSTSPKLQIPAEEDLWEGRRCEYVSEVTARRVGATYRVSRQSGQFLLVLDEEYGGKAVGCPIASISDVYCSDDGAAGFSKLVWDTLNEEERERVAAIVFAAPDASFCRVCLLEQSAEGRFALFNLLRNIRFGTHALPPSSTEQVFQGDTAVLSQPASESDFEGFAADF